jgi:hypothetical protein
MRQIDIDRESRMTRSEKVMADETVGTKITFRPLFVERIVR